MLERAVARAQKHRDVVRPDVSGREIQAAVAREITRNDYNRGDPRCRLAGVDRAGRRTIDRSLEGPVAVTHEHRDRVGVEVGDSQIEMAVAEVTRHDRVGVWADGKLRHRHRLKRAIAIALQNVDRAKTRCGHSQVDFAVAEIAGNDRGRIAVGEFDGLRGGEAAPVLVGQDRDV